MKILISTQLSFKSTLNNICSINHWLLKPWHFGKFCHFPCFVHQIMSHVWPNGKFPIFLFLFGLSWHFGKFRCWPCFVHQVMSHVWSNGKFPIFLFLFGTLAVKAMAFWEISLSSHQNLLFLKHVKISLIF